MIGAADVLNEGAEDRPSITRALHQVAEEFLHQCHISNVCQEDGDIGQCKHCCTFWPLRKWSTLNSEQQQQQQQQNFPGIAEWAKHSATSYIHYQLN